MKFKSQLVTEIKEELESIGKMEVGSDEHKGAVDSVSKLMDRAIELEKLDVERVKCDTESYYKAEQITSDKKDRIVRDLFNVASIVVPTALTIWGTFVTLKFEEEGTVTTTAGRNFFAKLFPKK